MKAAIKAMYTFTELGRAVGLTRWQMARMIRGRGIPTYKIGVKNFVCLDKLREHAPEIVAILRGESAAAEGPSSAGPDTDGLLRTTCSVDDIAQMTGLSRDQVDRYLHSSGIAFHKIGKTDLVTLVDLASRTPGLLKSLLIKAQVASVRASGAPGAARASGANSAAT